MTSKTIEEQDKEHFQKLYRIIVRLFYDDDDHLAIPIVDYMVMTCQCAISLEKLENTFKLSRAHIAKALSIMM
jgi:hypothetical protein